MDIPRVAAHQAGAFSRRQAIDEGLGRDAVRRRISSGRWTVLLGDVLVERGMRATHSTWAWAAHLATGGVVSHQTAGVLHGLIDAEREIALHVSSRTNLHVLITGVNEHRVRLDEGDVVRWGRLPITSRTRTVIDLLAYLPLDEARRLLFRAVQQGWLDEATMREHVERRRGMKGNTQLRDLMKVLGTGAHSVAERVLHQILASIPGLEYAANVPVVCGGDRYVLDVLVPAHRMAIEVDGRRFHSDVEQFNRDRRRQNALVGAGYIVLRFTWLDLIERPDRVRADVLAAISVSSAAKSARTGP